MNNHGQQPQREHPEIQAWRQARRHINEYEDKLRELQFDLRREQDRLKAAQEQHAHLKAESEAAERAKAKHQAKAEELDKELVKLENESQRLTEEAARSAQQVTIVQADLANLKASYTADREAMQCHLEEQERVKEEFQAFMARRAGQQEQHAANAKATALEADAAPEEQAQPME